MSYGQGFKWIDVTGREYLDNVSPILDLLFLLIDCLIRRYHLTGRYGLDGQSCATLCYPLRQKT